MTAPIVRSLKDLRAQVAGWRRAGDTIGLVPTMGALHEGHLSLVAAAKAACDRVIVTIFINPRQFNSAEDLANYPKTEEQDRLKLAPFNVDVVYVPEGDQIYPEGFATTVSVGGMVDVLCGAARPGHFDGVATVVTKLFLQSQADQAFFGEKDFQQVQVVTRLARDLDIPITVVACPTIREEDGLAMSSRNLLLSDRARSYAPELNRAMEDMAEAVLAGADMAQARAAAIVRLERAGFTKVDYFELRASDDLRLMARADAPARLFAAAWLAGVRLIDNIAVG